LNYCLEDHPVRIIALDSCPSGRHDGELDAASLAWLQATLAADTTKSYQGPAACLLHLWDPAHGLVSHVSYIGHYPGPYDFF